LSARTVYRTAELADVAAMAQLRVADWGSRAYWLERITGSMTGELHPRQARPRRTVIAACAGDLVVGFAAGHLTRRLGCTGELQWLNVDAARRRTGVATELLHRLAGWFVAERTTRVCVDAADDARPFYLRRGAEALDQHWLVWPDISTFALSWAAER
jgi:GNAT superfamily N-acetyltransferase